MEHSVNNQPKTFTSILRTQFKGILDTIASGLNHLGLKPNTVTLIGLIGNIIGAVFLAYGQITSGGIVVLLMGPIDALDGSLARLQGKPKRFGAFLDSVVDRYSELIILGGLLAYYLHQQDALAIGAVYLAAAGSVLVSYTKGRAEALGFKADIGILTRVERYLVLAPCLVFNIPLIGLGIIAILANFTAFQRIWTVWNQAKIEESKTAGAEQPETSTDASCKGK